MIGKGKITLLSAMSLVKNGHLSRKGPSSKPRVVHKMWVQVWVSSLIWFGINYVEFVYLTPRIEVKYIKAVGAVGAF